jgi:hypothetical protein
MGLAEAEAQAFVVAVLTDRTRRGKLDETLIARCQKLMRDRRDAIRASAHVGHWCPLPRWRKRVRELYDLAGEVAAALEESP